MFIGGQETRQYVDKKRVPSRLLNLIAAAVLGSGAALSLVGLLFDVPGLIPIGGALVTGASVVVAVRLWRWSQRAAAQTHQMREWEFRPGYLVALLVTAFLLGTMFLDAGREDLAAWTMPAALVLLTLWMGRARTGELFHDLLFPTRTPPSS